MAIDAVYTELVVCKGMGHETGPRNLIIFLRLTGGFVLGTSGSMLMQHLPSRNVFGLFDGMKHNNRLSCVHSLTFHE